MHCHAAESLRFANTFTFSFYLTFQIGFFYFFSLTFFHIFAHSLGRGASRHVSSLKIQGKGLNSNTKTFTFSQIETGGKKYIFIFKGQLVVKQTNKNFEKFHEIPFFGDAAIGETDEIF